MDTQVISSIGGGNKRKRDEESGKLSDLAARRAKRPATRLRLGSVNMPLNNEQHYEKARDDLRFFSVLPTDNTAMASAIKYGLTSKVVFGFDTRVIEGILLDKETAIPWTIPKVTVEYKLTDYVGRNQPYTQALDGEGELLLSPTAEVKESLDLWDAADAHCPNIDN